MKYTFRVRVKLPPDVTREEMADYIQTAVANWVGGMDPDDAMYELERESVEVSFTERKRVLTVDQMIERDGFEDDEEIPPDGPDDTQWL